MYNLIPNLTVKENMEVGAYLSDHPLDINDLLKTLGLYDHRNKLPNQLSGGQQQRTSIGRAIIKNPSILLCDEPTGALDYHTSKEILKLIEDVNQKYGNTVIMVTHNDAIKNMADRVIRLRDGQIRKTTSMRPKSPPAIWTGKAGWKYENPLRKRLLRELKNDIGKYLVIFLFMTATIGFVSGFLVADESMLYAYDESFEKYNVENGNFTTEQKLTDNQRTRLEKRR